MFLKFRKFIKEVKSDGVHVAMAAGRFTGATKEHHKLLQNLFSQKADHHYVFVMGPSTKEETTEKDPFTVEEKVAHLRKLYPDKAESFVPGNTQFTKTPNQAMAYVYHQHKHHGRVNLTVVAGSGSAGVKTKSAAGGSIENYRELVAKYNKTKFPERIEGGKKIGGDYRMNYSSTNFVENPRGETSGSVVRKFAHEHDHTNPAHVAAFKKLLHPNTTDEDASMLMRRMREAKGKK